MHGSEAVTLRLLSKYKPLILSLLLFAAWLFHFAYPVYYLDRLAGIRAAQNELISTHQKSGLYLRLDMSEADYAACSRENGRELYVRGTSYDVVCVEKNQGKLLCTVLKDDQETSLNKRYASSLGQSSTVKIVKPLFFCWLMSTAGNPQPISTNRDAATVFFFSGRADVLKGFIPFYLKPPQMFC